MSTFRATLRVTVDSKEPRDVTTDLVAADIYEALTKARQIVLGRSSDIGVIRIERVHEEPAPADLGIEAARQDDEMNEVVAVLEGYVEVLGDTLRDSLRDMNVQNLLDEEHREMVQDQVAAMVLVLANRIRDDAV